MTRQDAIAHRPRRKSDSLQPRDRDGGFTLVELLVVLVILSLVMGLVGPRVLNYLGDARAKTAQMQIESLSSALDLFFLDIGRYPTEREGLTALIEPGSIPGWNGPYVHQSRVPVDPWGQPYQYRSTATGAAFDIRTLGPDGSGGGGGSIDITSR
ncbi:type II secretion system major pseudopilin GspG [Aurantimonas sp. HBX-1]|uniref:type II secretion system major pseudopilin GspG n=1 Tax=Aurantimonas sp. HBX-1 TaxID=2906072 RepID=UPI001F3C372D|nr:type II secretion system major pseudopilin GspG [Aurantimonas sp. HBX-1]UIJ73899.1 type II secretion system major pseudopilin GspG [Aurantimonas sp. HBX-1]